MKQKRMIEEGAVFLVPLPIAGFGVGVVIRRDGKGRVYGAFFAPRVEHASDVDVSLLRDENAILRCRFGDYGLHHLRWPVIGSVPGWASQRWILPRFVRGHDDPRLCFVTTYGDDLRCTDEQLLPVVQVPGLPHDSQLGSAIVEATLAKLLGGSE